MADYNVLIPSFCRQVMPEITLPLMDALQATGNTPVVMDMQAIGQMYQQMRYTNRGCYEIFGFYIKDLLKQNKIDFGLSVGLGSILEDSRKGEAHNLLDESGVANLIYLHTRSAEVVQKLCAFGAQQWHSTYFAVSSRQLMERMEQAGLHNLLHLPPATSPRLFFPALQPPADAAFPVRRDDPRLADGFAVSFVGSYSPGRAESLSALAAAGIELAIFGDPGWKKADGLVRFYRGQADNLQEANTVYCSSRISLDLPHEACELADYISQRPFDCLAGGNFVLTGNCRAIAPYFEPDYEIAAFASDQELVKHAKYYLEHEVERHSIVARGRQRVLKQHLWPARLEQALPRLEMHLLHAPA